MLLSQNISLQQSENRERLLALASLDTAKITDAEKTELSELSATQQTLEAQYRAAIQAEAIDTAKAEAEAKAGSKADGEVAERAALLNKAKVSTYMTAAATSNQLPSEADELAAALKVEKRSASGNIIVPWEVLEAPKPEPEQRAATTTTQLAGPTTYRPILQRLFGRSILQALGVRLDSVGVGKSEYPLLTAGVAPAQKAEGTAADAATSATFTTVSLKPKRLTGEYEYSHEVAASVEGIESALRQDLTSAVMSAMSSQVINGDGTGANPTGIMTRLSKPADPDKKFTLAEFTAAHAEAVDGIHAESEREVSSILGVDTYKAAAQLRTSSGEMDGLKILKDKGFMCIASSFIPAASSDIQSAIYHLGMDESRGDSIAAVWGGGVELIRDPYTKASTGTVLTWITLWDAYVAFRSGAYKRVAFKLA